MDKSKREMYLEKIEKETSTVGVEMPDNMEINDINYPVGDILFNISSDNTFPDSIDISESDFKKNLIEERQNLVDNIKNGDITEDKANSIVKKINRIDRIINTLTNDNVSFEEKNKRNKAKKTAKWRNFVDKIKNNN